MQAISFLHLYHLGSQPGNGATQSGQISSPQLKQPRQSPQAHPEAHHPGDLERFG